MIRRPAVAGQFYPAEKERLEAQLRDLIVPAEERLEATAVISPHAGYIYSGAIAGKLFGMIRIPSSVIILGPNHTGCGAAAAISPDEAWETPLGTVPVNHDLAQLLMRHADLLSPDSRAHEFEHSLEVQVPFLRYLRPDVSIVPICLGFGDFDNCRTLGEGIASALREWGEETLVLASSDMTHFESAASAREKDGLAVSEILKLNPEGLLEVCRRQRITMCGVVPSTVALVAAAALGARQASLCDYATSGDVTGDNSRVVAYASVIIR